MPEWGRLSIVARKRGKAKVLFAINKDYVPDLTRDAKAAARSGVIKWVDKE
jgi:hypothetical protein